MPNFPMIAWDAIQPAPLDFPQRGMLTEAEIRGMRQRMAEHDVGTMAMLRKEIDKIVQAHQSGLNAGLNACLERWVQQEQLSFAQSQMVLPGAVYTKPQDEEEPYPECTLESIVPSEFSVDRKWEAGAPAEVALAGDASESLESPASIGSGFHRTASSARMAADNRAVNRVASRHRGTKRRNAERIRTNSVTYDADTWLRRVTTSRYYEWFSGSLILINAIFIGVQTEVMAVHNNSRVESGQPPHTAESAWVVVFEVFFCLAFSLELGLRWVSDGWIEFFRNSDLWWNIMDVVIVFFSVFDLIFLLAITITGGGTRVEEVDNISAVRVMRAFRVVRVVRVIRVLKFFRELRMMIHSILKSLKSLMWVIVVLSLTFYLFAVMFTSAVTAHLEHQEMWSDDRTRLLVAFFGTLGDSVLNLFMAMSGGRDWVEYYEVVSLLHIQYRLLFLLFITFSLFAVVNVVTAVFVDSALQQSYADRDIMVQEEIEAKKRYLECLQDLFHEIDDDGSNCIGLDEFTDKLDDERVLAFLHAMKLDVSDATTLFKLMDTDNSGQVNIEEFLTGCLKLQGEARALDTKIMQKEVRNLMTLVSDLHSACVPAKQV
eukprot:CAMPEP_0172809132 /NCGR_PEP_ID=MMETSP1075-20121228/8068_1 /TAXON_ID=2916 /ORGANISM="Ceratium fusus, Strain PA161109" /LENGTH=600 /DNA_ID=CAMNT_0013648333 /DNA_START=23 /DNA_END=1825 /DNA_ORIENTATION=+